MWRKYGDDVYASIVLAVFSFEALVLGVLTWSFALRASRALGGGNLTAILVASIAVTALSLVLVGGYVLAYHVLSNRRERGRRERLEAWTARWVAVLFGNEAPPIATLPAEGVESLLDLREHLVGTEGERVESLVGRYGIGPALLDRTSVTERRGLARILNSLRHRRLSTRLEALEALAKARLAQSVEPLLRLLDDREESVRLMALRSLARSLARMPEGPAYDRAILGFAEVVMTSDLPAGAVEESLLLLEDAAPRVLSIVLATGPGDRRARLVARAMDAAGRLKLLELADDVAMHLTDPEPEVRAAALRALGRVGILPAGHESSVAAALRDGVEFVRVQAAHTALLLPGRVVEPELWALLGDESWWVRRAAANSLLLLGARGPRVLERAGRTHPDRYARHMAVQVLLDAGRLEPAQAALLRGTA
jgi:HEAT repeat protein